MFKPDIPYNTVRAPSLRILFLTLDIYRQTGGIQQVNKLLAMALGKILSQAPTEKSILDVYSLHDGPRLPVDLKTPLCSTYRAFDGNRYRFVYRCLQALPNTEILILSHIHLLPVAMLLCLAKPKLKLIMLAHGFEIRGPFPFWKTAFLKKRTDIWAVSAFTALHIGAQIGHRNRIKVLNNALPPDFVLPLSFEKPKPLVIKHGLSADQKVLLTVCRINRHTQDKGIEQVFRSISHLLPLFPKISYFIIGEADPVEKQRLEHLADQLDIRPHVTFLDFLPPAELTSYYLLADVFVMPSKREGFGLAFIEAAACGCRIIAGNTDGSADALLGGKLGTLVDPDDLYEIDKAIVRHLNQPYSPARTKRTHHLCLKHFSIQAYQSRVQDLLYATDTGFKMHSKFRIS